MPARPAPDIEGRSPRYQPRTALPIRVCSGGTWQEGHLVNLSERGAFVTLQEEVWTGEEVQLSLEVPDAQVGPIELRAFTVWRSGVGAGSTLRNGYGLAFRDDKDSTVRIRSLIDHLVQAGILTAETGS